jgi:sulfoxide reductase heme-binding subunit YedZ
VSQPTKPVIRTSSRPTAKRPFGLPWNDPRGRFSPFKTTVLVALTLPGLTTLYAIATNDLGARPVNEVIHQLGLWAIRLLLLSLAVTPLRQIFNWPKLLLVRRMVGVAAFAYLAMHFCAYIVDESFDLGKVASEIVLRLYLTIGFVALAMLAALAVTSTDGMVRRLGGRRWQLLHRLTYAAAILGSIHYFMQSKANIQEPLVMGGLLLWMMAYRCVGWLGNFRRAASLSTLLPLAVGSAVAIGLGEAIYYYLLRGIDIMRVLSANWTFTAGWRPTDYVLLVTLAIALAKPAVEFARTRMPVRRLAAVRR